MSFWRIATGSALLLLSSVTARAQEPEKLLSPTSQLVVRWDGVTAHKAAYDGSALGSALRGPTGDSARADEEFRRGGVTTRFLGDRELRNEEGLLRLVRRDA